MAKAKKNQAVATMRAAQGRARAEHFAAGGTAIMWSNGGRRVWTAQNRKAVASKRACRSTTTW